MRLSIISVVAVVIVYSLAKRPFAGKYEVIFRSLYLCNETQKNAELFSTKVRKINRTHSSYSSKFNLPYGFTDKIKIKVDISVWGNGGWRENFMNFHSDQACTLGRKIFPKLAESFYAAAGYNFTKCPIPAGWYEVKNWTVEINIGAKILPYGKYRMKFYTEEVENISIYTCTYGEGDIIPLRKH